jgi:hypothetical protein
LFGLTITLRSELNELQNSLTLIEATGKSLETKIFKICEESTEMMLHLLLIKNNKQAKEQMMPKFP